MSSGNFYKFLGKCTQKFRFDMLLKCSFNRLECLNIADIVFCGIMTNICIESTVRDAFFRDFRCFVPADAVGSVSEKLQIGALRSMAYGFASVSRMDELISRFR